MSALIDWHTHHGRRPPPAPAHEPAWDHAAELDVYYLRTGEVTRKTVREAWLVAADAAEEAGDDAARAQAMANAERMSKEHRRCKSCRIASLADGPIHICAVMPFDEPSLAAILPDSSDEQTRKGLARRCRKALLEWDIERAAAVRNREDATFSKVPKTIGDLLRAGRCSLVQFIEHVGYIDARRIADVVQRSIRDAGLEWFSPDGHFWVAQPYGGKPAPQIREKQIWATCICWRSGWLPPSRVFIANAIECIAESNST